MKLDLKDTDLFGHQIKISKRAKLLHLKYFKGFLNFYLFCEISFNFLKMSIFYGFLNKLLKNDSINQFIFSSKLEVLMSSVDPALETDIPNEYLLCILQSTVN